MDSQLRTRRFQTHLSSSAESHSETLTAMDTLTRQPCLQWPSRPMTGQTARLRLRSIFSRSKIAMEVSAIPAVPPPTQNRMLWIRDGPQSLLKRNPRKKEARPAQLTVPQWPLSLSLLKHPPSV